MRNYLSEGASANASYSFPYPLLGCLQAAVFAGHAAVNRASECSFYLKTADDLGFAPPIVDGCLRMSDVERSLSHMQESLIDFA